MIKKIRIGGRLVGDGEPTFIIAEAGSNHNGKLQLAKKLIDVAKEAGADAVKFQTFSAGQLYSTKTPVMTYLKKKRLIKQNESIYDLFKRVELPRDWHRILKDYCQKRDIIFMSTPFDIEAVNILQEVRVEVYKIASFEITHLPLLEFVAKKRKPIILSTGMADLFDIETALKVIYKQGNRDIILLHCAINYPAKYEDLNLRAMQTMRQKFQLPVGFSDHTLGISADIAAVSLGACVIEKHFTISRRLSGLDHPFALEPEELKLMVKAVRDTEVSLGSPEKKHTKAEEELYKLGRRSLVAACDIPKGKKLTKEMIAVKRPGYGIHPKMLDSVIGKTVKVNIEEDDILTWDCVRKVKIRPAIWQDGKDIWRWRNDKITRSFSFNTKFIPLKTHLIWFKKSLSNENRKIFIVEEDGSNVGMVRFDFISPKNKIALISVNITPEKRGQGLGLLATKRTCKYILRSFKVKSIIAEIKKINAVSVRMFSKAGFDKAKEDRVALTMKYFP